MSIKHYITKAKGGLWTLTIRIDGCKHYATDFQDKHQFKEQAQEEFIRWMNARSIVTEIEE